MHNSTNVIAIDDEDNSNIITSTDKHLSTNKRGPKKKEPVNSTNQAISTPPNTDNKKSNVVYKSIKHQKENDESISANQDNKNLSKKQL